MAPPPPSGVTSALTNILLAQPTPNFKFYVYNVDAVDKDGKQIMSASRRNTLLNIGLFDKLLKDMPAAEKESIKRKTFLAGNQFFAASPFPGLETLPFDLLDGTDTNRDTTRILQVRCYSAPTEIIASESKEAQTSAKDAVSLDFRCADCTMCFTDFNAVKAHCNATGHTPVTADDTAYPATPNIFLQYANKVLERAMGERMARWGQQFIDPKSFTTPRRRNGQEMGVHIFQSYLIEFSIGRPDPSKPPKLMLTIDLRAKVIRTHGILHTLCKGKDPNTYKFTEGEMRAAKAFWIGQQVISKLDKTTYSIHDLVFDKSADSLMIEDLGMSHTKYFRERKKCVLEYPAAKPMIAVLGRNKSIIHFPPELVCSNDLDDELRSQLPQIASFQPSIRNEAIETVKKFLIPGAQTTKGKSGLLPALGIVLSGDRLRVHAEVMPIPILQTAGLRVNAAGKSNWAPMIAKANFDVNPNKAVVLSAVVIHHSSIGWEQTYKTIASLVNSHKAVFRLPERPSKVVCAADDMERHWGSVETHFSSTQKLPPNVFVLDFTKPRKSVDVAYPVVKKMFASGGILSQFVNFRNCDHERPADEKRSKQVLYGVARQILNKAGVAIWWIEVPRSLPLPAVFVGVDVYHAPRAYDPKTRTRVARPSVAAIVVRVIRDRNSGGKIECYSETFKRGAGEEYNLGQPIEQTVRNAMKSLKITTPGSCVVWRDGVGDSAIGTTTQQEIPGLRKAIGDKVPVAMVVCQKRIATKFLHMSAQGAIGCMPAGTLVQACADLEYSTFYINGTAPPYATAKPARFLISQRDPGLAGTSLVDLTWGQMCDYPNWTGTIKVPAVCQLAHLLAEHAGNFSDSGDSINHAKFANHLYFL